MKRLFFDKKKKKIMIFLKIINWPIIKKSIIIET